MTGTLQTLSLLDASNPPIFQIPQKKIDDAETLKFWLESQACSDVVVFLMQLNYSMFPLPGSVSVGSQKASNSPVIQGLAGMISKLEEAVSEVPPDPGPRRFGNKSFRKWYDIVQERVEELLQECLPESVWNFGKDSTDKSDMQKPERSSMIELKSYLMGSFGSEQRLDYGTGHELSFIAFLGGLWKLNAFEIGQEMDIVLGIVEPYLSLVRLLIKTYNLEPAGSHGVWGLDDHSFIPYIFGSAELSPARSLSGSVPLEGSISDAPKTGAVTDKQTVEEWRKKNMYFSAIGFIYDVKKGPFWEHSPMLYDISGVPAGWAKINKGMLKMYQVEVLSKFPVVQHFPFGGLYKWERDPNATSASSTVHLSSTSKAHPRGTAPDAMKATRAPPPAGMVGTTAPWAAAPASGQDGTKAPWANSTAAGAAGSTRAPWAVTQLGSEYTKVPLASQTSTSRHDARTLTDRTPGTQKQGGSGEV